MPGYSTDDPAAGTDYTFASFANNNTISDNIFYNPYGGGVSLYNDQMPIATQHERDNAS
jgi:parallel beta-helix repeat protein